MRNPGHVPVEVVFVDDPSKQGAHRYLVRPDMTVGGFMASLRDRRVVRPSEGLFLLYGGTLPPVTRSMADVYAEHQDEAGLLVCELHREKTFG